MSKVIDSKPIYTGAIFTMSKDRILLDKGEEITREIIHHHGGCGILALRDAQVLLVSQYRYALRRKTLEIPAGKIESGESPDESAMRELEEESGFACRSLRLFSTIYPSPGFCTEKLFLYEAEELYVPKQRRAMDEDEEICVHWIPLTKAIEMMQAGTIADAKTIIALQHALLKEKTC